MRFFCLYLYLSLEGRFTLTKEMVNALFDLKRIGYVLIYPHAVELFSSLFFLSH